ncbi:MAG: class I SAM-dependent methyltransferase [Actinobacteria bacterium]|nr:class I SAM-dependent methyltransferase [Actinomycetota bacterium]
MRRFAGEGQRPSHPSAPDGSSTERSELASSEESVADALAPVLSSVFISGLPVQVEFWDSSVVGPPNPAGKVVLRSPTVARRLLWSPLDLGWARAYAAGEIDLEGDIFELAALLRENVQANAKLDLGSALSAVLRSARLGVLGPPLPPPPEEVRLPGRIRRTITDEEAISHHYDVSNEFYRLVLGPSMTYSCARFDTPSASLEDAQESKHELICRKLGLPERPGARLLDVGCGWGSMALHAAVYHGAHVVGVTISEEQAQLASKRVADAGLQDRIEIRLQHYQDLAGEQFDAISSIGMFEHVGAEELQEYFQVLGGLLAPYGRMLNHAISSRGRTKFGPETFIGRYIFPNGELADVAEVVEGMQSTGLEVRDVESLREHYELTLRAWVGNLEEHWDWAVEMVGEPRARIWRLYMAGSAMGFRAGRMGLHQVLGVVPDAAGATYMPRSRRSWELGESRPDPKTFADPAS